jgi:hypothetical protein
MGNLGRSRTTSQLRIWGAPGRKTLTPVRNRRINGARRWRKWRPLTVRRRSRTGVSARRLRLQELHLRPAFPTFQATRAGVSVLRRQLATPQLIARKRASQPTCDRGHQRAGADTQEVRPHTRELLVRERPSEVPGVVPLHRQRRVALVRLCLRLTDDVAEIVKRCGERSAVRFESFVELHYPASPRPRERV